MRAFVFPGQGAQFSGMGKDLHASSSIAKRRFDEANDILGFDIASIMFEGSDEALKQTSVTQPAIFLHSVILAECLEEPSNQTWLPATASVSSAPWWPQVPCPLM